MLTTADVPEDILELYAKSKIPVTKAIALFSGKPMSNAVDENTDLVAVHPSSVVYVRSGMFRYMYQGRFVRFYSTGDMLVTPAESSSPVSIVSEFGADILVLTKEELAQRLTKDGSLLDLWLENQRAEEAVMHALCSLHSGEEFKPNFEIRQYEPGADIIKEGDNSDNLFEMLEGEAVVTMNQTEIGSVAQGEIFGEVSFLTGKPRCATVKAQTKCLVQVIKEQDFEKISRHRPTLVYKLSKNLATRLSEVNRRLVSICSMT
ncbi:MAG: Crp/Fnr family transcriptional regulator [Planctomycetota bacterium]|jgi:hypothetical protein